ncbi:uncharacterized protein LOC134274522, partial [Saccostrea cucullata]|uniref:uncharacterized protein LOC134274522 n=1 Tax=Saccostrea cuccullata TaxID=36930 RepID=UPI002ECFBD49
EGKMMPKLSTVSSFTCLVLIILTKGCEGQSCTESDLKKCNPTYHIHKVGLGVQVYTCSGLSSNVTCVQKVVKDCESNLDAPGNRIVHESGKEQLDLYNVLGCDKHNGGRDTKTNLVIMAVLLA